MNYLLYFLIPLSIGYFLGSIPFGFIVGKAHGIDLTAEGSGSTGTTNALRLLGKKAAFLVLLGDFLKGLIAPILTTYFLQSIITFDDQLNLFGFPISAIPALAETLTAFAVLFGHSKSIWIGFKGGKSVASGVGTLFALDWRVGLITALIWASIVFSTKYSSLGALIAVPLSPIAMYIFKWLLSSANTNQYWNINVSIYVIYCLLGAIYIVIKHQANIKRLLSGTEPKIGQKKN